MEPQDALTPALGEALEHYERKGVVVLAEDVKQRVAALSR